MSSKACIWVLGAAIVGVVLLAVFCPVCLLGLLGVVVVVWVISEEIGGSDDAG